MAVGAMPAGGAAAALSGHGLISYELARVAAALRRVTVGVGARGVGAGSGVIWRPDGLIVTNAHVAQGRDFEITLWHGRSMRAELLARDPKRDLALLSVDARDLPAASVGDPAALRTGEIVVAFGHPLGVANAVALGIVHAPQRGPVPGLVADPWVRADIRLAPGNSGGPLADVRGRVVGINTLIYSGLGVAVSVSEVRGFVAERAGARAA